MGSPWRLREGFATSSRALHEEVAGAEGFSHTHGGFLKASRRRHGRLHLETIRQIMTSPRTKPTATKVLLPIEIHMTLFGLQATHKPTLLLPRSCLTVVSLLGVCRTTTAHHRQTFTSAAYSSSSSNISVVLKSCPYSVKEKVLFLTFRVLVPRYLLETVANPACGLLNPDFGDTTVVLESKFRRRTKDAVA